MKSSWIAAIVALSITCLLGSYFLLPKAVKGVSNTTSTTSGTALASDTLALPEITEGVFERLLSENTVQAGDTLGYVLRDRYAELRDSLFAFAKTGLAPKNYSLLPKLIRAEFMSIVRAAEAGQAEVKTQKERFLIRGEEREYLSAELMGAEDASTELLGKLNHLNDAGRSASDEAIALQAELKSKQSFIAAAKKRLAQKEQNPRQGPANSGQQVQPLLTEEQRARIQSLSAQLPVDTQRVFAPIAGRYYRPDNGLGYIIVEHAEQHVPKTMSMSEESTGYILKADGQPVLWGTAQRIDSLAAARKASSKELKVSLE